MRWPWWHCVTGATAKSRVTWYSMDQAHRKRNLAEYEGDFDLDEQLVAALLRVAREVAKRVVDLLKS